MLQTTKWDYGNQENSNQKYSSSTKTTSNYFLIISFCFCGKEVVTVVLDYIRHCLTNEVKFSVNMIKIQVQKSQFNSPLIIWRLRR